MKINIWQIIIRHIHTLKNNDNGSFSRIDIIVFYLIPFIFGAMVYYIGLKMRSDAISLSITFYGIFLALLLNIQVGIFSIYTRKWIIPDNNTESEFALEDKIDRQTLLTQLNINISYLTVISCIFLGLLLVFYISSLDNEIISGISVAFYAHFLMTFAMISKRAFTLFDNEYRSEHD